MQNVARGLELWDEIGSTYPGDTRRVTCYKDKQVGQLSGSGQTHWVTSFLACVQIGVGRLRLNGLVSLDAPYTDPAGAAVLTTKPIIYQGSKLLINLDAGGGGSLVVQVYKQNSPEPLLTSNVLVHNGVELEAVFASGAAWGGGRPANTTAVAALAGTPVVLVLRMQDCKLYGLQFQ